MIDRRLALTPGGGGMGLYWGSKIQKYTDKPIATPKIITPATAALINTMSMGNEADSTATIGAFGASVTRMAAIQGCLISTTGLAISAYGTSLGFSHSMSVDKLVPFDTRPACKSRRLLSVKLHGHTPPGQSTPFNDRAVQLMVVFGLDFRTSEQKAST